VPKIVIPLMQLRPDQHARLAEIGCKIVQKIPGTKHEHAHYEVKLPRDSYYLEAEGMRAQAVVQRIEAGGWGDIPHKLTWRQATAQQSARMLSLTLFEKERKLRC